jgi:hypothetical protein
MILSDAKREFEIRCCYWLRAELENEITNSFPNLRLFRSGYGWKLHQFMQKLESSDQLALANAMVKRNSTYLAASGETMTAEENALWYSFERFFREPSSMEMEIQARRQAGEKIKMASKGKLRKASLAKFVEAYGSHCFDMKLGEEWDPLFLMKCCGWIVSTQLTFGRRQPVLTYGHKIVSETRIAHLQNPQITGPAMTLSPGFAWLVNQWEDIMEDDLDLVCNALVRQAGCFLAVAPRLLAGLEFDKIVP